MHYFEYNESIQHRTGEIPLAYYRVDAQHPRYRMRMHWHRETELLRVTEGELELFVDDERLLLRAGDLVVLGEGAMHGGEPNDAVYECIVFDPYSLLLRTEACESALKGVLGKSFFIEAERTPAGFTSALDRLYECAQCVQGRELKTLGALYEAFGWLAECTETHLHAESTHTGVKAEQLKPALEYIEKNYSAHISLETLARLTGLSPKYFCRCFRAITHRSPIDYLNYYRIECASYFLRTSDMTVAEVAQRCGYNDSSFFIKQFRRYKDTTPLRYRAADKPDDARR